MCMNFLYLRDIAFLYDKYKLTRELLNDQSETISFEILEAPEATYEQLARVHSSDYLDRIFKDGLWPEEARRIGLEWSPELALRESHMVGACIEATKTAIKEGKSAVLGGGTHHAFSFCGEGYCVYNDIFCAYREEQIKKHKLKMLIVDLDVHQGNGNAALASAFHEVYTLDIFCQDNFPFKKVPANQHVGLESEIEGDEYLNFSHELEICQRKFKPDLIYFIMGVDVHEDDKLGKLNLNDDAMKTRTKIVLGLRNQSRKPAVFLLGGGYLPEINKTAELYTAKYSSM